MNKYIYSLLFGRGEKIEKNSYIWNTIAGLINASEAVLILMVVTRTNGLYDAGILTIAFSIANLFMTIGKFGIRNFQVTDASNDFNFRTYRSARFITTALMFISIVLFLISNIVQGRYNRYKAIAVFFVCGIYLIEAFEDVYLGEYQRKGRLDVASRIFSYRWIITLAIFTIILILYGKVILAAGSSFLVSFIIMVVLLKYSSKILIIEEKHIYYYKVFKLLKSCLPLFATTFLSYYITNAPRYAIDKYLTSEVQACYGFIAMPIFIIGLLNSFIYQPMILNIALLWKNKKMKLFFGKIIEQIGYILLITFICVLAASAFGVQVLDILYSANLSNYKEQLLMLLISGGGLAIAGFFSVVLTIMREQRWMLGIYCVVALLSKFFSDKLVLQYQVYGAAVISIILMFILSLMLGIVVFTLCIKRILVIRTHISNVNN